MGNKAESDHLLQILENLEILEILEIPPVKRPDFFFGGTTVRVHAKGVVLCERTCFCLLSTL